MEFELTRKTNGIQSWNRLYLLLDNGKKRHIDIKDDEIRELEETISVYNEQYFKEVL